MDVFSLYLVLDEKYLFFQIFESVKGFCFLHSDKTMADDLSKLWEDLSLTEVEDDELCIPKDELEGIAVRGRACILGKLIANRMICRETLRTTMIRL